MRGASSTGYGSPSTAGETTGFASGVSAFVAFGASAVTGSISIAGATLAA